MNKFTTEMIKIIIETYENKTMALAEVMKTLADRYGEGAINTTANGGLSCNAFRENAKLETKQKAADKCGLSLEKAEELAAIIQAVNTKYASCWQAYQNAYFGKTLKKPEPVEPKEKTESELRVDKLKQEKIEYIEDQKAVVNDLKIAKAELALAKANKDKASEKEAQGKVDALETCRGIFKSKLTEIKEELSDLSRDKRAEPLRMALLTAIERIEKSKLIDDPRKMTVSELLTALV